MLLPSAAEPALAFGSNYVGRDILYEWMSNERWQSDSSSNCSEAMTSNNFCTSPSQNNSHKRRKLQNNAVVIFPVEPDRHKVITCSPKKCPSVKAEAISEEKLDNGFDGENARLI